MYYVYWYKKQIHPTSPQKSSREMIRLIPQGKQIHLTERIFPYHETDEKANVMSFLIILVTSLDLLSILLKTDSNKIVFFAVEFLKEKYEEIYNRNIGDASIHQYDVSYGW